MLRRILSAVSTKLNRFTNTMEEVATQLTEPTKEGTGEKRALELEAKETDETAVKKTKFEPAPPMQGRADRKRKVALLLAYCGAGYYGLQIQKNGDFKTVESELIKALLAAELIPEEHSQNPSKMMFQRAARTDKNVSAVGNVISLKMLYDNAVSDKINTHLPKEIRVITCLRTTRGFDSKNHCTARTYKYMLPTYSFSPVEKFITKDYRLPEGRIQRVNEVLAKYVGTHNFHNFTSGRKPNDPSSKRYMISFECAEPFVRDGIEFAILTVKGQSFMLHHIRKMIGLMIPIVRGHCGEDVMEKAWQPLKVDIPKAPGVGLFLDQLFFTGYNKKFGQDGMHEPLVFDRFQDVMDQFKEEYILSHIAEAEAKEGIMMQWLGTLQYHKFDVIDPNQEVPPDGENEKVQNWGKTRYLLKKLAKGSSSPGAETKVPETTSQTENPTATADEGTIKESVSEPTPNHAPPGEGEDQAAPLTHSPDDIKPDEASSEKEELGTKSAVS